MFLDTLCARNQALIDWAVYAHKHKMLPPNTYVIDLEGIRKNAKSLQSDAHGFGLELFMMTKQFGRNPLICRAIADAGIEKAVAVNPEEAEILYRQGIQIGHVGHLVQIPNYYLSRILAMKPDYITVVDYDNAKKISDGATGEQKILLRVTGKEDLIYPGQHCGFQLEELVDWAKKIEQLKNIPIAGVTAFPCFVVDKKGLCTSTPNFQTLLKGAEYLRAEGFDIKVINAPGGSCSEMMKQAVEGGVTQLEPGHAFTGTTYINGVDDNCVQKPCMLYLTELSHNFDGLGYVFGGGFYSRGNIKKALVWENNTAHKVEAFGIEPGNIDYYAPIRYTGKPGAPVIYAFRTQIFMVNAHIAVVDHVSSNPRLLGVFDKRGDEMYGA